MEVRDLRRRWKPVKERLFTQRQDHPTIIRFHRACSWMQHAQGMAADDLDTKLTCQWIAFNALYGQWDARLAEPMPDRACWRLFCNQILSLDKDQLIAGLLEEHKTLVLKILDDAYLASFFWRDPSITRAQQTTRKRRDASMQYVEKRWGVILECVLENVYFLRCQLIHGAATYQSDLNRTSLKHCSIFMNHFLPAVLTIWTDHGADHDWGVMCYPPVHGRLR